MLPCLSIHDDLAPAAKLGSTDLNAVPYRIEPDSRALIQDVVNKPGVDGSPARAAQEGPLGGMRAQCASTGRRGIARRMNERPCLLTHGFRSEQDGASSPAVVTFL